MNTGIMLSAALLVSSPGAGTPDTVACQAIVEAANVARFPEVLLKAVQLVSVAPPPV